MYADAIGHLMCYLDQLLSQHSVNTNTCTRLHVCTIAGEFWTSADIVDCIVSYAVTQLMSIMTDENSKDGADMLARVCCIMSTCVCCTQQRKCDAQQAVPSHCLFTLCLLLWALSLVSGASLLVPCMALNGVPQTWYLLRGTSDKERM